MIAIFLDHVDQCVRGIRQPPGRVQEKVDPVLASDLIQVVIEQGMNIRSDLGLYTGRSPAIYTNTLLLRFFSNDRNNAILSVRPMSPPWMFMGYCGLKGSMIGSRRRQQRGKLTDRCWER